MQRNSICTRSKKVAYMLVLLSLPILFFSCAKDTVSPPEDKPHKTWDCEINDGSTPDYITGIGCKNDFTTLASEPMDATIPGATSLKTVIDLMDPVKDNRLYFTNSKKYPIHWNFASNKLSGNDFPTVQGLSEFKSEYSSINRRFILGAISYYEGPKVWVYEIAPYDNASAEMITKAYKLIADSTYFGDSLYFHPTSDLVLAVAKTLPSSVKIITTDQLYAGIDYQPLNCAESYGKLAFYKAADLDTSYLSFRNIVVLDAVPNDISVCMGIITETFQTPLAHINVLSNNRGTPNMALRGAWSNTKLRELEGRWVKLKVSPLEYTITEVPKDSADAWWDIHRPAAVGIPNIDTTVKDLRNVEDILDLQNKSLGDALKAALPAFGGKASHFSAFPHMDREKVPYPKAFGIPIYYYLQFMKQNGFDLRVSELLADPAFQDDPAVRDSLLTKLRKAMEKAPVDPAFTEMLMTKLNNDFPGDTVRFRSSTNAEDLDGFTGAGLYTSKSGDVGDQADCLKAIKKVWASVWFFRAFEERTYRKIDHNAVGMALLVHQSYPREEASGVAITANIFDQAGLEPGFYVNVQYGDSSVVLPNSAVTTDQFIYHYSYEGKPTVYLAHSNILPAGKATVLTPAQIKKLGEALLEIHEFFQPLYGKDPNKKFAMDTEFKFDESPNGPDEEPVLFMKQCRPYY